MNIEPIQIRIKDSRKKHDVALLVDRPDYLEWIQRIRHKWNIEKPFKLDQFIDYYSHIYGKRKNLGASRIREFKEDIKKIRLHFYRTQNFDRVIEYSIAFGVISEDEYRSCYWKTFSATNKKEADFREVEYALVVTPTTTEEDLLFVFSQNKQDMFPENYNMIYSVNSIDQYRYQPGPKFSSRPVGAKKTDRTRDWYWVMYKDVLNGKRKKPISQVEILSRDDLPCETGENLAWKERCEKTHSQCSFHDVMENDINVTKQVDEYAKELRSSVEYI